MLRATVLRTLPVCRVAARPAIASRSTAQITALRMNSSDAAKVAQQKQNELQKDWSAPTLTYEDVKPKTVAPSPVSPAFHRTSSPLIVHSRFLAQDAYLIDVREPDEVIQGSIPSSVNIPLSALGNDLHLSAETFKSKYGFEKPRTHQELVFYCRSGRRSASASDIAKRNGYQKCVQFHSRVFALLIYATASSTIPDLGSIGCRRRRQTELVYHDICSSSASITT